MGVPSTAQLQQIGACDIRIWVIEWNPPLSITNPRRIVGKTAPVKWKCQIDCVDMSRPPVVAIRDTAEAAETDCKLAFWQFYSKRPSRFPPPAEPANFGPDDFDMI